MKRTTLKWVAGLIIVLAGASGISLRQNDAADTAAHRQTEEASTTYTDHAADGEADAARSPGQETADAAPTQKSGNRRLIEQPARIGHGVNERIVSHTGFTLSFNRTYMQPNWVAWELTGAETEGTTSRSDDFQPDPLLPQPQQVTTADYTRSGYDRGHQCPSADMKWSEQAMRECFYMSNICPQNPQLNRGSWATLEKACRRWAKAEGSVYIVCGPVFESGKKHRTIGRDHTISVPDGFFKVVLSLRKGHEKAIGFYYRNSSARQTMEEAARTVDEIEEITGINFYVNLNRDLETRLEKTANLKAWH